MDTLFLLRPLWIHFFTPKIVYSTPFLDPSESVPL